VRRGFVGALLLWASFAAAQGLFDTVTRGIVDIVNDSVGITPSPEVRRVQIDAARVALRGDLDDWERLVDSTIAAAGAQVPATFDRRTEMSRGDALPFPASSPRGFVTPGGTQMDVLSLALGRPDPSGRLLPVVIAQPAHAGHYPYPAAYVLDPIDGTMLYTTAFAHSRVYPLYDRNVRPGTLFDLDGDGIDEIFWMTVSATPHDGPWRSFHQRIVIYAWRTDENDHVLPRDRTGVLVDGDVSYVAHGLGVSGYSTLDPGPRWSGNDMITSEIVRGDGRDRLFVTYWLWPDSPHGTVSSAFVARPLTWPGGDAPVPWHLGHRVWTKEVIIRNANLELLPVESYVPWVCCTEPPRIVAHQRRQEFDVTGGGFRPGATVRLHWNDDVFVIPPERTTFVDSTRIRILAGVFPASQNDFHHPEWWLTVTNPDGTASARFALWTEAP
jgi:hypothetical protein